MDHSLSRIVSQSRVPDEVLAVDDASRDDTFEVISRYANRFDYIRPIKNAENQGVTQIAMDALEMTTGDYFCGIGADDPVHDGFFNAAMSQLEQYPAAGLCCSDYLAQFTDGRSMEVRINIADKPRYFSPGEYAELLKTKREISLATCTTIWKVSHLRELGGVIPELCWHYDWFNALVIAFRVGFCYVPGIYQTVSFDENSYSFAGQRDWNRQRKVIWAIFNTLDLDEFDDVRDYFKIPAVISKFGPLLIAVLLENKAWHKYLSWELLQYILDVDEEFCDTQLELNENHENSDKLQQTVVMAKQLLMGMSAQYAAKAQCCKNDGDDASYEFYMTRAEILSESIGQTDPYQGLGFRHHDYWRDTDHFAVRRWLRLLTDLPKGIRVALYGTGKFGRNMYRMIQERSLDIHVKCFVDRDNSGSIDGLSILSPEILRGRMANDIDCVLLCSTYYDEVLTVLETLDIQNIALVDPGEMLNYQNEGYGQQYIP